MTNLKEYIDFAISLTEMVEVKSGKFPIPKEIVFNLNKIEHAGLQTQIHDAKKLNKEEFEHKDVYTLEILGIDFKFITE
jgi:hypothetical protein